MRKTNKSYEDLKVWQRAIDLSTDIYKLTSNFPKEACYGLTSQLRRASVSIASNIAEGCSRNSAKEFVQFLSIALGSIGELKTQIIIANRIGYLPLENSYPVLKMIDEAGAMLNGLQKSILSSTSNQQPATSN